jgi:hypothetical protein
MEVETTARMPIEQGTTVSTAALRNYLGAQGLASTPAAFISALADERNSAIPSTRRGISSSVSVRLDLTAPSSSCSIAP